jgi:adenine-specific DNA-methyltransferase
MVRPIIKEPPIRPEILAVFLNSTIVDQIFRCVSGSVAVSAYELEALPLPPPRKMERFGRLVRDSASRDLVESACAELYDGAD